MDFESIRLITFDCYGTLIDWETGMLASLRKLFSSSRHKIADDKILEMYGEVEAELESGSYIPYRQVLAQTVQEMGRRCNIAVSKEAAMRFAQSLTEWEPFADTVAGLQALTRKYRLGIISNIDDDLFAGTRKKLLVDLDPIVTAQQVQSYKPSLKNFQEAIKRSGLSKEQILHAGQSVYHDIVPSSFLGLRNVWVNRPSVRPGSGAAKPAVAQPSAEVHNLSELVGLLMPKEKKGYAANPGGISTG